MTNSNSLNNDNKSNNKNNTYFNESNKTKYQDTQKYTKINNDSPKTKLIIFNKKSRKLIHKPLVYDSLDDEEKEEKNKISQRINNK